MPIGILAMAYVALVGHRYVQLVEAILIPTGALHWCHCILEGWQNTL